MYRQSEKLVKQQYLLHMSWWYGELRPTNGWDLLVSLGHPCKFQWVSRLGSITARHSSSGHHPNFAALYRGRHLYSAGRPSCWALAHISSLCYPTFSRFSNTELWETDRRTDRQDTRQQLIPALASTTCIKILRKCMNKWENCTIFAEFHRKLLTSWKDIHFVVCFASLCKLVGS